MNIILSLTLDSDYVLSYVCLCKHVWTAKFCVRQPLPTENNSKSIIFLGVNLHLAALIYAFLSIIHL